MRILTSLFAGIIVLISGASTGSTAPLPIGSAIGYAAPSAIDWLHKVHGRHCKRQWSKRLGWHRHQQACGSVSYAARGLIPGHVLTPYGYRDCIGWWERHPDGRMQCHGQYVRD
jgi:hypothetical protein